MTSKAVKEIADRIVSNFHLSVVIFYNNCWMSKPNLFQGMVLFQLIMRMEVGIVIGEMQGAGVGEEVVAFVVVEGG